jgi:hypothetical protein
MAFPTKLKQLCQPAYIYFVLSFIALVFSAIQNMGNSRRYNLGSISCPVSSCMIVFIVKILVILFWTWVLNLMCKDGHSEIAWFLVLLPFVLFFLIFISATSYYRKMNRQTKKQVEPLIL